MEIYLVWQSCGDVDTLIGIWPDRARANGQIGEHAMGLEDGNGSRKIHSNKNGLGRQTVRCASNKKEYVIWGSQHGEGPVSW